MSVRLPKKVRREIWDYAYAEADRSRYLEGGREEHIRFQQALYHDPRVGGRLREYMDQDKVAAYIRHTILNNYAKGRRSLPREVDNTLTQVYGQPSTEIDYDAVKNVSVHHLADGRYVAVARAIASTWDAALRRLILYVAAAPGLPPANGCGFEMALFIYQFNTPLNGADRALAEEALRLIGIRCLWL